MKKIAYIDLDGVVADYDKAKRTTDHTGSGFFENLELIDGAKEAIHKLSERYDLYFLSTAAWSNPACWMEKRLWVEKHFGELMFKRLILTHNKGLLRGAYLIDDRIANGVDQFIGEHIHYGTDRFPNWQAVLDYLEAQEKAHNESFRRFMQTR